MTFTGQLYPYQQDAVDRMVERQKMLVAFDLGTGKTVLTIAAIERLRDQGKILGPTLVVALSSLKYQWQKEVEKFSDSTSIVIDGTKTQRQAQYALIPQYDYAIVNYEQVVNDWEHVSLWDYDAIIMDEATAIKSFRSKRSKKVKELVKSIPIRFGLTGTPIENGKPEELYSILQAIDDTVLGQRFDLFDRTFIVRNQWGGVQRYRNLSKLHERLKQVAVRKSQTDEDVAPYLPDTIEKDPYWVPLDRYGARAYRYIADMLQAELEDAQNLFGSNFNVFAHYGEGSRVGGPEDAMRGSIMSKIMSLRMLCNHPALITNSATKYDPFVADGGSAFLHAEFAENDDFVEWISKAKSPKLDALESIVKDHLDSDEANKLVIFTSYVMMADLINGRFVGGVVYTGKMDAKQKEAAKVKFQTDPNTRILISTDAGGYGVDLPQANMLINYDLPWSSGLATQRNGRIKRASSKWPSIIIQDTLVADSIEQRMHASLQQKNAVASAVVDGKGINEQDGVDMTAGSLLSFLKERQP